VSEKKDGTSPLPPSAPSSSSGSGSTTAGTPSEKDAKANAIRSTICETYGFRPSKEYMEYLLKPAALASVNGGAATSESIVNLLLAADLRSTTKEGEGEGAVERHNFEQYFPNDINLRNEGSVMLPVSTKPVVLQITTATTNIANTSKYRLEDKHGDTTPRLLSIGLTDGHVKAVGIEISRIDSLKANTPPGTKIQYFGGEVVDGKILLNAQNCRLLGGAVPHLLRGWQANNSVQRARPQGGEGPPLFDFNPGTAAALSSEKGETSLGVSTGVEEDKNPVSEYVSIFSNPTGIATSTNIPASSSSSSSKSVLSAEEEGGARRPKVNAGAAKRMIANQLGIRLQRPQKTATPQEQVEQAVQHNDPDGGRDRHGVMRRDAEVAGRGRSDDGRGMGGGRGRGMGRGRDKNDNGRGMGGGRGGRLSVPRHDPEVAGRGRGRGAESASIVDGLIASLVEMGYSDRQAVAAVHSTAAAGLQEAVDWMLDADAAVPDVPGSSRRVEEDFPSL